MKSPVCVAGDVLSMLHPVGVEHRRLLEEGNVFEEPSRMVVAGQLAKAMKKKKTSKARMAVLLKTSGSQVDRLLDPKRDITLSSLQRAAALFGQRVMIELV
jgi:antitoxin HicB